MTVKMQGPIDIDALIRELGDGQLIARGVPHPSEEDPGWGEVELESSTHSDEDILAALEQLGRP